MKNIADVLKQKETELQSLEREVEALRLALRLCSEAGDGDRSDIFKVETAVSPKPVRGVAFEEPQKAAMKQFP